MISKVSIVMATYNGEEYVVSQLDSIRTQTYKADEVIICDDCSTDSTFRIIQDYIKKYKLDKWEAIENKKNLGWKENFYNALKKSTGDIVFFSDQDDIWENSKVLSMINVFKEHKNIEVLCCTTQFMDSEERNIFVSREALPFSSFRGKQIIKNPLNKRFTYSIMPGCTMAVRRSMVEKVLPFLRESMKLSLAHDALFWKLATIEGTAYILNKPCVRYRIHANNASAPQTKSAYKAKTCELRKKEVDINLQQLTTLKYIIQALGKNEDQKFLDELIDFCNRRYSVIENKTFFSALLDFKYYRNMKMLFGDIFSKR